ncbi:MAG: cation:proton antiporter [Gammaproteobacteria bacterium]|nr:cation:proton antiporter [Gammaproteobacteria bacterium]
MTDIVLILLLGVGAGLLARRIGQSAAVAQVLIGIVFGPPLLNWIGSGENWQLIGELGVLLLLGMAGMHLGLDKLVNASWRGFRVAVFGMVLCFVGGYFLVLWWGSPIEEALYVGVALTATSIGISVQVLQQFGLIDKDIGRVVIAAAVIDDVIALYLLAITHGALTESLQLTKIVSNILIAALVFGLIFTTCKWLSDALSKRLKQPLQLLFSLIAITGFGWLTQLLGYSVVVGAFFAGLGLGEGMQEAPREKLVKQYDNIVLLLVPFFFVHIGSQAEWRVLTDKGMTILVLGLIMIALFGKIFGGYLGAWTRNDFSKPLLIGISMVPRGEVALVIASIGFQQGHISHHVLIALILMAITAALLGPALMSLMISRRSGYKEAGDGLY